MESLQLLTDLHRGNARQGPGGDAETRMALKLIRIDEQAPLKIADIGCGTGAATLILSNLPKARVTAVDFLQPFLDELKLRAKQLDLAEKIIPVCASMDALPFEEETYDLIWSEGAIYNIGFDNGINKWRRFLKPNGALVVSEISWLTSSRPKVIEDHWVSQYPEIASTSENTEKLEKAGYSPLASFVISESCWLDNYYRPLSASFTSFLQQFENVSEAKKIVQQESDEISLYEKYRKYYGYVMYIARKVDLG